MFLDNFKDQLLLLRAARPVVIPVASGDQRLAALVGIRKKTGLLNLRIDAGLEQVIEAIAFCLHLVGVVYFGLDGHRVLM
jgi:hypothetical protein